MVSPGWRPLHRKLLQAEDPAPGMVPGAIWICYTPASLPYFESDPYVSCTQKWFFSREVESFVDKTDICGPESPCRDGEVEKQLRQYRLLSLLHNWPREGLPFGGKVWMLPSPELTGTANWNGSLLAIALETEPLSLDHRLVVLTQLLAIILGPGKQSVGDKKTLLEGH